MPKFSIIVPIYNVERYLERCIDSLIHQTLQDIEIILVDDGSPDGCPDICDRYAAKDSRITVIHKKNGGVSAARNDGLAVATGKWVIFCDSDDWMELDACEALYNAGEKNDVDVVVADINRIKGNEIIYNKFFAAPFTWRDRERMDQLVMADLYQTYCSNPPKTFTIGYGGPWNKAVRRSLLLEYNITFDVSLLGLYDDILYTAYVYATMGSITYISKPVYNYVVVETSITKSYKPNSVDISYRIFTAFEKFLAEFALDGKWNEAYYALVIRRFEETLRLYFFSRKNLDPLAVRLRELKKMMQEETCAVAAKKVRPEKLMRHQRRIVKYMQCRNVLGLYGLYRVKYAVGKIQ